MDAIKVNDKELIELAIQYGYTGKGFDSAEWKSKQSLLTNGKVQEGILKVIRQVYGTIEIEGTRKNRVYFLSNKHDTLQEKQYNYTGRPLTQDQIDMNHFIYKNLIYFQQLADHTTSEFEMIPLTYNKWAKLLGFKDVEDETIESMENKIKSMFGQHSSYMYNSADIVRDFKMYMRSYHNRIIKLAFSHLENQGKIRTMAIYQAVTDNGEVEYIPEETYRRIEKSVDELFVKNDIKKSTYYFLLSVKGENLPSNYRKLRNQIVSYLMNQYGFKAYYSTVSVKVLSLEPATTVEEFKKNIKSLRQSCMNRYIHLLNDRTKNKTGSDNLSKRFEKYTGTILCNMLYNFILPTEMIDKVMADFKNELDNFSNARLLIEDIEIAN